MRDLFYVLFGFTILSFAVFAWIAYAFVKAWMTPHSSGCFSGVESLVIGDAVFYIGLPALLLTLAFGSSSWLIWRKYIK